MDEISFENQSGERIGPGKEKYLYYSSKAYFTYGLNRNKFQKGYLGLNPSEVSGIFHIRYPESKPLKARKIELYFFGIIYTQWADYNGYYCSNSKEICKKMKCIWKANSNEENLTSLDFPFKFTIPNESPSSINYVGEYKANGTIYYTINAIIYRKKRRIFESSEKVIEVRVDIKRWQLLSCPDYNPDLLIKKNELFKCQVLFDKSTFDVKGIINVPINFQIYKQDVIVKKLRNNEAVINCSCITELFEIWHKVKINILMGKANSVKFKKVIKLCNIVSDDALEEYMVNNFF
ncbi:17307_t:CDS:2 [Dentiscutata heterogama]|uniref:17307_t:CDS:1 n=1 Tax=Dentiscutata heterogama TaxID=1316150 RepID=A0ACA9JWF9_9GLOM|nr:17307_t:CDS:2 [Dentiscutata heterogama]